MMMRLLRFRNNAILNLISQANKACPYFPPRCKVIHAGSDNPPEWPRNLQSRGQMNSSNWIAAVKSEMTSGPFFEKRPDMITNRIV